MPASKKNILFVSHNASRTGAPHILKAIIQEFKDSEEWNIQILSMEDGPLVEEFQKLGHTLVWYKLPQYVLSGKKGLPGLLSRLYYKLRGLIILSKIRKAEIVFLNTITNGHIHEKLTGKSSVFITYVHELYCSLKVNTSEESLNKVLKNTDFFFTGSGAVQEMLVSRLQVNESNTMVLYSSLPKTTLKKENFRMETEELRRINNIPVDAFVVGIIGTGEWRKGFDWLYPLVKLYLKKFPAGKACFIWKGVNPSSRFYFQDTFDFEKSELLNRVILLPHGNDGISVMTMYDLHLLLSREDPYPVVVLEAAAFAIPTLSFKEAGGSAEFIGLDAGICVEYGDLDAMADEIIKLERDRNLLKELGRRAEDKERDHKSDKAAQTIMAVIQQFVK